MVTKLVPKGTHVIFLYPVLLLMLAPEFAHCRCQLRCGVLRDQRSSSSLYEFTQNVWSHIQLDMALWDIDIQFVEIQTLEGASLQAAMDEFLEIGHKNVSCLLGPYVSAVATASENIGSPYLATEDVADKAYKPSNLLSVAPTERDLRRITLDVLDYYQWEDVALFYDGPRGSALVQRLALDPSIRVRAWRLGPDSSATEVRTALLYVRQLPLTNIVLLGGDDTSSRVLDEALTLSMLSNRYTWILPSMDVMEDMLLQYAYTQVRLLTFDFLEVANGSANGSTFWWSSASVFSKFEYFMIHDSLLALYNIFDGYRKFQGSCNWPRGGSVLGKSKEFHLKGITGPIHVGKDGSRQDYVVKLMGFGQSTLEQMGLWNSSRQSDGRRLNMNITALETNYSMEYPMGKAIVKVVTMVEKPFVQVARTGNGTVNGTLEGYCVDLLEALARILDFEYELYLVPDGTWAGLTEEVINGNASMIMASLTITAEREKVIDFSKPFKTLGIGVVMRRPTRGRTVFEFMLPLSKYVWLLLLATVFVASIAFFLIHRLLPTDSYGFHFGLQQSVWFTVSSLFRRDTDVISISVAAKIVTGVLWFASIIIMSSFTANWAAYLTLSQFHSPIQSMDDLIEQTAVKYGTVRNTQVSAFFQNSKLDHLNKMWQFMSTIEQDIMVNSSEEGFEKVRNSDGSYAFFWDSPVIEYESNEDCDLMAIGQSFDSRGYGVGVPLGAKYRDDLTLAILKLGESGELQAIEKKWWRTDRCKHGPPSITQSLTMERVSGVFAIMAVAILVSVPISGLEYWNRHKKRKRARRMDQRSSSLSPSVPVCTVTEAPVCDSPPMEREPHNIVFRNRASFRASHHHRQRPRSHTDL